mmetsp:Transcript_22105/g.71547  ORF Transcript_22105/g.71547 Transcript_22105/m.71547 type:complete len:211 (+) Transcript_22105:61-693(+)|eukprot:CAMPEP_0170162706 /NCGR_PEP_ID=MMETSP0033_2-20121228/77229_1 /TAXON_ID=195969 /ORGANISM="Dolichomastix tenuilepis, Strain CCMP3274" /LENGTH=210 /DNA_ID=CAMNT_0010400335 /DNA_START=414 /DNA_END=1046 /DNA_ORIENTATION=+
MVQHNNQIVDEHFRKDWQVRVKTWFEQPMRAKRRRNAREAKAKAVFPRPSSGPLRPAVHAPTVKYNTKVRLGRGFTLEELKEAGIPKKLAPTIGIAVDHRRKNRSAEAMAVNVKRLQTYKSKLILFPKKGKSPKAGDSKPDELAMASQLKGTIQPITKEASELEYVKVTDEMKSFNAYQKLRTERMNARQVGNRIKRAEAEAAAEKEKAK